MNWANRNRLYASRITKRIGALLGLLILVQCKQLQPAYQSQTSQPTNLPGTIFLSFKMYADTVREDRIVLLSKINVAEVFNVDPENVTTPNRIVISQLDHSKNVLASVSLDHPLNRRVEVANDQGEFQSKMINLPEAEFFARVTLQPQTAYIHVTEIKQNRKIYAHIFNLKD